LPFLDELFDRDDPDSQLGVLSADSFAAALLDRMLTGYFDAIDAFEDDVDELEVVILQPRLQGSKLPELRRLRRAVSLLRRMLTSHRTLFDALPRPDFRPQQAVEENGHFAAVSARYERAVDAVMDAVDAGRSRNRIRLVAERQRQHRAHRRSQPADARKEIAAKVAVIDDAGRHQRMRELQKNRASPAGNDDDLAVDLPTDRGGLRSIERDDRETRALALRMRAHVRRARELEDGVVSLAGRVRTVVACALRSIALARLSS
jgi:hypothetical protein